MPHRPHKLHIACFRLRPKSALISLLVLSPPKPHTLGFGVAPFRSLVRNDITGSLSVHGKTSANTYCGNPSSRRRKVRSVSELPFGHSPGGRPKVLPFTGNLRQIRTMSEKNAPRKSWGRNLWMQNYTMQPTVSGMMSLAPVLATTSSTVTPGAVSSSTGPSGVISMTASSETT